MAEQELHVWLTPDFSVRKETLCFHEATKITGPVIDWKTAQRIGTGRFCLKGKGHNGKHDYTANPDVRLYSFREPKV